MPYYIRILSPSERIPNIAQIRTALKQEKLAGSLTLEDGTEEEWMQILLSHDDDREIAVIERNAAALTELVAAEIAEFLEEITECKPLKASSWLASYLPKIRTIYAFQLLSGTDHKNGWDILGKVKDSIHSQVGGILQADMEGFTNEEGFQILWQFSDSVTGPWWMGVLIEGKWVHFQMDLGNLQHREAFFRGEVPDGVQVAR